MINNIDPIYKREDLFQQNQRILNLNDKNQYHVTRSDFSCPNTYQLNLLKANARSKFRAFLPKHNRTKMTFAGEIPSTFQPINVE